MQPRLASKPVPLASTSQMLELQTCTDTLGRDLLTSRSEMGKSCLFAEGTLATTSYVRRNNLPQSSVFAVLRTAFCEECLPVVTQPLKSAA